MEKIFEYEGRSQRHKEKKREKSKKVEETRTLKCHRAILIYDGREIGSGRNFQAESGNREIFVQTFIGAFRGWLAIKKMYPVSWPASSPSTGANIERRGNEKKLGGKKKGGNYFRGVEIIFDRLEN